MTTRPKGDTQRRLGLVLAAAALALLTGEARPVSASSVVNGDLTVEPGSDTVQWAGEVVIDLGTGPQSVSGDLYIVATETHLGLGAACSAPIDCANGLCVDGVCCDALCPGGRCDAPGTEGVCVVEPNGDVVIDFGIADETWHGHAWVVDTTGPRVIAGSVIVEAPGGVVANGASCTLDGECENGVCSDGVCCATACAACGVCNLPGSEGTCLPRTAGSACRESAGACDVTETCNGGSVTCPADAIAAAGTLCRAAGSACDIAETCTGASAQCPDNELVVAGTVCRPRSDLCDAEEACTGSPHCPPDELSVAGTACRAGATPCDPVEMCTGSSSACPVDVPSPSQCGSNCVSCAAGDVIVEAGPLDEIWNGAVVVSNSTGARTVYGDLVVEAEFAPPACGDGVVAGAEVCDDGNTNACDGCSADCAANETLASWYADRDSDGFGDATATPTSGYCAPEGGSYATNLVDCNDDDPAVHPEANEVCGDAVDNDCAGDDAGSICGVGDGLLAVYYDNADFTGPSYSRVDPKVGFAWGLGSPDATIAADTFSARWTGFVEASHSETYTFYTYIDDGVRLWVNGELLVDRWTVSSPVEQSAAVSLLAGVKIPVVLEYFENTGSATAQLSWSSPSTAKAIVPQARLYSDTDAGAGLLATYYNNADLTGTSVTRADRTVDFAWGTGSPDAAIGVETFSARWAGTVKPDHSETYTFYTYIDDGVRVWVNGELLVDRWAVSSPVENSGTVTLLAGVEVPIVLEYFENTGGATAQLRWSSPSTPKQIIAQRHLDFANSRVCGNGVLEGDEPCDDAGDSTVCDANCTPVACGDGSLNPAAGEACDDGNTAGCDGCAADCSAIVPVCGFGDGLSATYYENADFTGTEMQRIDPVVSFAWGTGAPDPQMEADTFSVRWTGTLAAEYSEPYTLVFTADDGVRLWLDDQLLIDAWENHIATEFSALVPLVAGTEVPLRIEYHERTGGALAVFAWESPSTPRQEIPQSQLYSGSSHGDGLAVTYYDNADFTGRAVTRVDPVVHFDWALTAPESTLGPDYFSARWTGYVEPLYTETYTFYPRTDDGVRLWVDGQLLVDHWISQAPTERSGPIFLSRGVKVPVVMEYYEATGGAVAELRWSSPSTPKDLVPQSRLFSHFAGYCGNGIVEGEEACDDAGESAGCDADCTLPGCGDGQRNSLAGEACDEGLWDTAWCNGDCTAVGCGDGYVNAAAGEVCDDGNRASCDGCTDDCAATEVPRTWYTDVDADGYGDATHPTETARECAPVGYVADASDCDDANAATHHGLVLIDLGTCDEVWQGHVVIDQCGSRTVLGSVLVDLTGALVDLAGCVVSPESVACGNGVIEAGEDCEAPFGSCCNASNCRFALPTEVCRLAAHDCDAAERCTGGEAICPADALARSGTRCDDGGVCTFGARCDEAGSCLPGDPVDCPPDTACATYTPRCDGTPFCAVTYAASGTACDTGLICAGAPMVTACDGQGVCQ